MRRLWFSILVIQRVLVVLALLWSGSGCTTTNDTIAAGIGVAAFLAHSPNNEIEQIYYLGVYDPQEQVPPTVYRVRVHGQASAMSFTRFSSGWVPADVIDSLGTRVHFEKAGGALKIEDAEKLNNALPTGRKLVLFGPEGFRPAPKNHRLVIVMGSNPEEFFKAIDESLGMISKVKMQQRNMKLQQDVFTELLQISNERQRLDELAKDVDTDLGGRKEGGL
ncbi:MAG: hypothetical protein KAV87_60835 [Desulfobacteraceae bacterium]|nr:hypothetical protein [Desulfobacteraceae bacterium]